MPTPESCPNCGAEQQDVVETTECSTCGQPLLVPDDEEVAASDSTKKGCS